MTVTAPSRRIDRLLEAFVADHEGLAGRLLLCCAAPLVHWSALALLWQVPVPGVPVASTLPNGATLTAAVAVLAALALSWRLGLTVAGSLAAALAIVVVYQTRGAVPLWQMAVVVLAVGWIGIAIAFRLAGRRLTATGVLRSLLVAPLWLLAILLRVVGWRA